MNQVMNQVILPKGKSYGLRNAAQRMILMFEDVCNTIRDTPARNDDFILILRNLKIPNIPSLVCIYFCMMATYSAELNKSVWYLCAKKWQASWLQIWYLDADPDADTSKHYSNFDIWDADMLSDLFMQDEMFYRRILSRICGDCLPMKTSITKMKNP